MSCEMLNLFFELSLSEFFKSGGDSRGVDSIGCDIVATRGGPGGSMLTTLDDINHVQSRTSIITRLNRKQTSTLEDLAIVFLQIERGDLGKKSL